MATFTKRKNYKNGGASYGVAGLRGSIYISGGIFEGEAPGSINVEAPEGTFAEPNTKAAERKARVEANKVERERKRQEREQARATKKAERDALRVKKAADREAAKAAKKAAKEAAKAAATSTEATAQS